MTLNQDAKKVLLRKIPHGLFICAVREGDEINGFTASWVTPRFTQDSETIETVVKEAEPGSLAVMFFKNLSNDEEQEYFCEGFSEDLLSMLSRYNKLVVISSHASFAYREKSKT